MRIVIDATSLADNFSGIERYCLNLCLSMIKNDNKNNYEIVFKKEVYKDFKELNNVKFHILNGKNKLIFNQITLPLYMKKLKADRYLFLAFPVPLLFRERGTLSTVFDLTAFLYPDTMKFKSMLLFKIGIKHSIKVSDFVITISESSKRDIEKYLNFKNTNIIYCGVSDNIKNFVYDDNTKKIVDELYNLPKEYIMCLGTLEPRKNLTLLIDSFIELKKSHLLKEKLVIVGRRGWKYDNIMQKVISEGLEEEVFFTGFVDDEYLPYIYLKSKCFVFPSIYEGFGLPPLEAMATGTIVITSDSSSLPEVVGDSGIIFKSESKEELTQSILNALNLSEEDRKLYIKKGLKRAEFFNWDKEAIKLIEMIEGRG